MKEINIFDIILLPFLFIGFVIGYIWYTIQSGFVYAEFIFDSERFQERYNKIKKGSKG